MQFIFLRSRFQGKNHWHIKCISATSHYLLPVFVSKRLSRCLSPTPRIYVITQYPAAITVQKQKTKELWKTHANQVIHTTEYNSSLCCLISNWLLLFLTSYLNSQIKCVIFDSMKRLSLETQIIICNRKNIL